jgi:CubicO group peptidase (beta-lactamase class C family)
MHKFLWLALVAVPLITMSIPGSTRAQSGSTITKAQVDAALPQLDKFIQDARAQTGVPGVAVAVVYKDQVVYLKGFGVRDTSGSDPVTPDTVFQLASLSKSVGSTVVAALVSDGVVTWDSKITDLDPSFQLHEPYPTSQLTLRDLYSHRSGLPGNAGNELESIGYPRDEILHRLRFMPPESSFRSAYSYSNFGMTEGGVAAALPTGKSWEELSKEKLYTPLGMTHTSSSNADLLKEENVAKLHVKVDGKWVALVARQPDAQSPAGGVSSTARDLAQWLRLQIAKGNYDGKQVIKSDALLETHVPQIVSGTNIDTGNPSFYALGWVTLYDNSGRTIWTHNGVFTSGTRSSATIYPEDELGIVVMANAFPTGLPEAISATFFDLVHEGKSKKDYLSFFESYFDTTYSLPYRQAIESYATPPSPVVPALEEAAYVGTYAHDYLGEVHVVASKDGLVLQAGPEKREYPLKHWNRDLFLWYPVPEDPAVPSAVTFTVGPDGKATHGFIDELNTNGQGILERVSDSAATAPR